jgi:hypothetical protein
MIKNYDRVITSSVMTEYMRFMGDTYYPHRTDGPAIINNDGDIKDTWMLFGEIIINTRLFCDVAELSEEQTMFMLLKYGEELPCGSV